MVLPGWARVSSRQRMGLEPQGTSGLTRIVTDPLCHHAASFTTAVNVSVMPSTEWHCELVADLASKCAALNKTQMMRICGLRPQIRQGCCRRAAISAVGPVANVILPFCYWLLCSA